MKCHVQCVTDKAGHWTAWKMGKLFIQMPFLFNEVIGHSAQTVNISNEVNVKDGLPLEIKNLHIHLYFIATKSLLNNALVEYIYIYIYNWPGSYTLVILKLSKIIFNRSVNKYC